MVNIKLTDITSDRNVRGTDITVRISLQYIYTQDMYIQGWNSILEKMTSPFPINLMIGLSEDLDDKGC